jgi:hypothetical protein
MSMSGPGVMWFNSLSVTRSRPALRLAAPLARA